MRRFEAHFDPGAVPRLTLTPVHAGDAETKTMEMRALFGGIANAPLDPCYHMSCDDISNLNTNVFVELSRCVGACQRVRQQVPSCVTRCCVLCAAFAVEHLSTLSNIVAVMNSTAMPTWN